MDSNEIDKELRLTRSLEVVDNYRQQLDVAKSFLGEIIENPKISEGLARIALTKISEIDALLCLK